MYNLQLAWALKVLWFGLWQFLLVCGVLWCGLWCFVVVCGVLWCLVPPHSGNSVHSGKQTHLNICLSDMNLTKR